MRRILIAFACFWLIVGIVLPLMDVVERATHIELVVKIEEPTEQEKAAGDFRGQIDVAGHTVLLMMEEGKKEVLYIDNNPVKTRQRKAEVPGVFVELGDERIERIICDLARPDRMSKEVLPVEPIEIQRVEGQGWNINASPPVHDVFLYAPRWGHGVYLFGFVAGIQSDACCVGDGRRHAVKPVTPGMDCLHFFP